ncbi:longitudinals lacking protein, isoforms H/M/V isoform X7 [Dendroctonus ponderosae]|uniref:BTB domain-containing protein n=1 Tax=Dendroctonus ponderosae TaxID=77166 RepID=A0AAR5PZD9_DENPD|nr:longitudinals lacking protein, isoforms H/M/V isoform X7 [Dendroctonus ponderosae]
MDDDQQFCLRWNNHQSTLVSVFDSLLEHEKLVDCTLAAEGKLLKAHKVVLSACSPYFETLLSRHYDKHPILILKDVKFQELKAMMDYMYRGEVNISQDQLGALLKAAESLQIKGLSDNKRDEPVNKRTAPATAPPKSPQMQAQIPKVQGLTIEQRNQRDDNREGSMSPSPRKRKRMRRKSEEMDNHHDASNSSDAHSLPSNIPSAPTQLPANIKMNSDVPDTIETKQEMISRHKDDTGSQPAQVPMMKEKLETHSELMLEPKSEYVEEMNEDSIEDLTLDDDDLSNMEQMDDGAGPSHGGEGSSQQGFGHWQMGGNQSQDEVFLAAQEAVGAHRDSQGPKPVVSACHSSVAHFVDLSHSDDDMYPNLHDMLDLTVVEGGQVMDMYEDLEGPFTIFCNICNTGFKHISSLRYHEKHRVCLKPKKDSSDPRCPKCDKVFATVTGFQYHMKRNVCENIKVEEVHSCEKCQTTFKHRASLLYHVTHNVCLKPKKEEVDPKALQCHLCDKVFSAPISLTYHLKNNVCTREAKEPKEVVEEEKECHLCKTVFKHPNSLRYHLEHNVCLKPKVEKTEPKVLQCEKCSKVFSGLPGLEYHMKRKVCEHSRPPVPGPPFVCDICNMSFDLKQTWYAHVKRQVCKKFPEKYMKQPELETINVKIELDSN